MLAAALLSRAAHKPFVFIFLFPHTLAIYGLYIMDGSLAG